MFSKASNGRGWIEYSQSDGFDVYKVSSLVPSNRVHPISIAIRLNLTLGYGYVHIHKGMNITMSDNTTLLKQLWQQEGDNTIYVVKYKKETLKI